MPALYGRVADRFCGSAAFLDSDEHVGRDIGDCFFQAAGPPDLEPVDTLVRAEAEKDARILSRTVAHAAFHLVVAGEIAGDKFQMSAISIAIAFCPYQLDDEPVIVFCRR